MATEPGVKSPEELARAFEACSGWEWLEGMITGSGSRLLNHSPVTGSMLWHMGPGVRWCDNVEGLRPDTSDPATLAIIAHVLLPKRWPGHSVQVEVWPSGTATVKVWEARRGCDASATVGGIPVFEAFSMPLAVALLRALEASP